MINTEITPIVHGIFVVFTQHRCHIIMLPAGVARLSDWNIHHSFLTFTEQWQYACYSKLWSCEASWTHGI